MNKTPNLGLTRVGISKEDKNMDFEDWRIYMAGEEESNMTILDKEVAKKIEPSNIKQGENVTVKINGNDVTISSTATGDITKEEVDQKIKEHNESITSHADLRKKTDVIKTDGDGESYLTNDGTYKVPKGGSGGVVVFDIDDYDSFTATENTTTFTIPNMSENKVITMVKDNLEMIKDVDYTIVKKTGVVTLNFTLNKDEKIYYKVVSGADAVVVYDEDTITGEFKSDADTLNGHNSDYFTSKEELTNHNSNEKAHENVIGTEVLATSSKTVKGAINETLNQIGVLPTLKTTNKENLVGAINENNEKVKVLDGSTVGLGFSSSCVDLNSKGITDIHNIATTPYRRCFGMDLTNAPSKGFYFYDVMVHSTEFATITAQGFGYGGAIKSTFTKELLDGTWQEWVCDSDKITALQAKTYQELPILRSGTVLNHILSSNVRFGLFNTVYDASTTDAPDTYWGTCRFTKQASNVWTVEWLSSVGNKRYQRTIYVDHWQEDKWSILATTDKIDISLLNGNKPIIIPVASKSGNIATINITLEFHNADICIVPFVPADTYYFKAENLTSQQSYRGAIYKDGKVNLEEVPTIGDRIIINMPYACV